MAVTTTDQTSFFNLPLSIQRLNPRPIDKSSVWHNYSDAEKYASGDSTAYVGQILSVTNTSVGGERSTRLLVINNPAGELKEVGTFSYNADTDSLTVDHNLMVTGTSRFCNKISIYNNRAKETVFSYKGTEDVLSIDGGVRFINRIEGNNGFSFGDGGVPIMTSVIDLDKTAYLHLSANLNLSYGHGISLNNDKVLQVNSDDTISLSAANKVLNIGGNDTEQICVQTDIYDLSGLKRLISANGDGNFPQSFKAGYGNGEELIKTYRKTDSDSGIIISKLLRIGSDKGPSLSAGAEQLQFSSPFTYNEGGVQTTVNKLFSIGYKVSSSLYAKPNVTCSDLSFVTDADFYVFDKPIEGKYSIGISGSKTQMTDGKLFFDDKIYIEAATSREGIIYHGEGYFSNNIRSVKFSSGFAGNGWGIRHDDLTGNYTVTADEMVIRKKFRVYELEVQKSASTNGSLWVTNSCSGDSVTKID